MRFYTNVQMVGDNFLVRGYEDGRHFMTREKFYPTLFVNSKRETRYKTLEGDCVEAIQPGSVRDCREFIKKYDGVQGFKIYGNERFIYQYISDKYPQEEIKFDEIQYSILNNQSDEERKEWEAFHLDLVVKETGLLPPHNRNRGKSH